MASQWIKIEHVTPDKPEVDAMANFLKIEPDEVVGKLLRFWIWADQQSISGNGLGVTKKLLDRITYCPGFSDSLISVGWLTGKDGDLSIPNFDLHNGESAKSRATTQKRVQKHRDSGNEKNVTEALPEKRREEKKEEEQYVDFRSSFDLARKSYPGDKGGITPEWANFTKKHQKHIATIVPMLLPAIKAEKAHKEALKAAGVFCPTWKNFQTWINKGCWTQEFSDIKNQGAINGTAKQRADSSAVSRLREGVESLVQGRSGQALLARG